MIHLKYIPYIKSCSQRFPAADARGKCGWHCTNLKCCCAEGRQKGPKKIRTYQLQCLTLYVLKRYKDKVYTPIPSDHRDTGKLVAEL